MKKLSEAVLLLATFSLLLLPTCGHGASVPVDENYEREGEAAKGWHGLLPIINDFLATLREGKEEKAYYTYTTEELQKETPLKEFMELVEKNAVLKNNKLYSVQSFYFDNGIAIFQGSLISTFGDSLQTEFDLKPIGPSWKIDGMHLFKPEMVSPPQDESES